jgi:flagellar biosynthesis protein FlhF
MNRKVFKAANIQQAIADIKEKLGPDAMILNTRKIPPSALDPYSGPMFEVEAAVPEQDFSQGHGTREQWVKAIKDDIADIKDIICVAGLGAGMHNMVTGNFESIGILASLLRAGLSEKLAGLIIGKAGMAMDEDRNPPDRETRVKSLKNRVMSECMNLIAVRDFFTRDSLSGMPHAAAFVGPTGVGKTTTIAKLAAHLSFHRKMRVGLVSIDNYRVGAFEQLKAYASIMGIPCVPAFSAQDLSCALDRMKSMDIVLIDTAGHSHFDKPKIDAILKIMKPDFRISAHLVLSVTAESIIMKEAASAFSVFRPDSVVFTKIDETKRCGKILDQINDMKLPVSMVTDGQRVPEDLIVPDKKQLLKIILGKGKKSWN